MREWEAILDTVRVGPDPSLAENVRPLRELEHLRLSISSAVYFGDRAKLVRSVDRLVALAHGWRDALGADAGASQATPSPSEDKHE